MPYIKRNRREQLEPIIQLIGTLDILGDTCPKENNWKRKAIVQLMIDLEVKVDGDLNYIIYSVCKRYVKPSYNNYKKFLTRLSFYNHNIEPQGELDDILYKFFNDYSLTCKDYIKYNNFIGEIDCCVLEIYRRLIAKYEDEKIVENGDIE